MAYVHKQRFEIRNYECDHYGRMHLPVMLNYLQEAAFGASAAVGYSAHRYAELGLSWFAYETDIEFMRPLRFSDEIEIKTWVSDFRRVRSLRQYEVYHGGQMVARASTDWVLIDTVKQAPTAISPEIVAAYAAGDEVPPAAPRTAFRRFPKTAPDVAHTLTRRVEIRDIDPAQHVNNAVYLHWLADAERQALSACGWGTHQLREANIALHAYRYQIAYKNAALLDDHIVINTWSTDVDTDGGERWSILSREGDDALIAQVHSEWGVIDATTGDARPLPDEVVSALVGQST